MASIVGANIREVDVSEIPKPWTKFYDNGVQETIEIPEIPVHKMYENTAKKYPNKIAFDFFGLTSSPP
ncbi:MAG: hypothetical protein HA490_05055 [Archaeoglobales archaeon]|nr:hypothetical protein [Archaeoglobales archaeon]